MVTGDREVEGGGGWERDGRRIIPQHGLLLVGISPFELRIKSRLAFKLFYIQHML